MLTTLTALPKGFLDCSARDLHTCLPGPTLIHLAGRRTPPLFVSILLHGNEFVGLKAIQEVLRRHAGRELPRALSLFVGNVNAAREGLRRLDDQPDYNRVWPGTALVETPEAHMMAEVVATLRHSGVFASIDIHNNTGLNPHYACLTRLDPRSLHLARLFSRIAVYFTDPPGVQSAAFAPLCPAVALECGKPGQQSGETHAAEMVDAALHLDHFPDHPVAAQDLDVYHTLAIVKVPEAVGFSFTDDEAELLFPHDMDHLNFRPLPEDTPFARSSASTRQRLRAFTGRSSESSSTQPPARSP